MATRSPVSFNGISASGAIKHATWTGLQNGDSGDWVSWAEFSAKSFQVYGTFGAGGTLVIEGSNDPTAPANAAEISSWQGTPLSTTSAGFLTARDMPIWVRPRVTGGDGTTSLTCVLAAHRADMSVVG